MRFFTWSQNISIKFAVSDEVSITVIHMNVFFLLLIKLFGNITPIFHIIIIIDRDVLLFLQTRCPPGETDGELLVLTEILHALLRHICRNLRTL
jgi:hypothetical protein